MRLENQNFNKKQSLENKIENSEEWIVIENPVFNENFFYRVVDEKGYQDYQETQIVRSSPTGTDSFIVKGFDIGHRPTAFPSFDKGFPDLSYLRKETNNYIFETNIPMYRRGDKNPFTQSVIKGRHWAYRPIDPETGNTITSLPSSMISNIYKIDKNGVFYKKK